MKCGAASRLTGQPCRRDVAPGFTRCFLHGGAAPSAKLGAERALAVARLPAIEALNAIVHDWGAQACDVCGRPNFENAHPVIRAAQIILDRTGFGPKATIEVTRPGDDAGLDVDRLLPAERDELLGLLASLDDLKERVRLRLAAAPGDDLEAPPARVEPVSVTKLLEAANAVDGEVVSPVGEGSPNS